MATGDTFPLGLMVVMPHFRGSGTCQMDANIGQSSVGHHDGGQAFYNVDGPRGHVAIATVVFMVIMPLFNLLMVIMLSAMVTILVPQRQPPDANTNVNAAPCNNAYNVGGHVGNDFHGGVAAAAVDPSNDANAVNGQVANGWNVVEVMVAPNNNANAVGDPNNNANAVGGQFGNANAAVAPKTMPTLSVDQAVRPNANMNVNVAPNNSSNNVCRWTCC